MADVFQLQYGRSFLCCEETLIIIFSLVFSDNCSDVEAGDL